MPYLYEIKFNKGTSSVKGPLKALEGTEFAQKVLRYPSDVGEIDKSHYVVFYIKVQPKSSFTNFEKADEGKFNADIDDFPVSSSGGSGGNEVSKMASKVGGEIVNKTNSLLGKFNNVTNNKLTELTGAISKGITNVVGGVDNIFATQRNVDVGGGSKSSTTIINNSIKRISNKSVNPDVVAKPTYLTKDTISMYMPDTLNYTYTQSYENLNMGGEFGAQVMAVGKSFMDSETKKEAGQNLQAAAVEQIKQIVGTGAGKIFGSENTAKLLLARSGRVVNPMLEMIYQSPQFRSFQFDFLFYPRDEKEAFEVQKILDRFRFHQAPEILRKDGVALGFLVPPSEFNIRFYYAGVENPNIPQIATCVLKNMDVNYAPNGFSAYEVPGQNKPTIGGTGMPTAIQLTLQFEETTYLTKEDLEETSSNTYEV